MNDDATLIAALKAAGHHDAASGLRDKVLAGQLREAGHETLADALVNGTSPTPQPAKQPTLSPEHQAGQQMVDQMRAAGILKEDQ
jgi:hypothetical protein